MTNIPNPDSDKVPLERTSLREQARSVLRSSIVTGELEPGRLYSVGDFATRFNVSPTPVRDALSDLAHAGLIEVVRNRGFVVPVLTEHDLDEIFQLRIILEVAGIDAMQELTAECRVRSRELIAECARAARVGDLVAYLETDKEFHLGLIALSGNMRLLQFVDRLRDQTRLYALPQLAAAGRLVESSTEHDELLDALEAGEKSLAASVLRRHLIHTRGLWAGREEAANSSSDGELVNSQSASASRVAAVST